MLARLIGRSKNQEYAQELLNSEKNNEKDAIQWASDVCADKKIYLQAVLLEQEIIWGEFDPQYKYGNTYHVPAAELEDFLKSCKLCTYYFGQFGINCALHPEGREAKECTDYAKK